MHLYHLACSALMLVQLALQEELVSEFVCSDNICYSVSWMSRRFAKSRATCKDKNGDLMTVKNSVQRDVINEFMTKVKKEDTRVWIGLEHTDDCTDLLQPLRGFRWVTGDNHTDYTNWRNGEQKCDASPLCVTVHKDGTWEETSCDYKADGYLCEISHSLSCFPLALPYSYTITYYHFALGMGNINSPGFPPGTNVQISTDPDITNLSCVDKSDGTVAWSRETPGAWSCLIENGGCEQDCVEVSGTAECKCPPESELKADLRGCTKPCDPSPCSQQCVPDPSPLGFFCMCSEGYTLAADGKTCEDIDDCAANPNICEHHCTNTIGGFVCECKLGFEMVNKCDPEYNCVTECQDIDECQLTLCEHKCENYPGGHRCVCDEGFVIDQNNVTKCKQICNKSVCQAECSVCTANCSQAHKYCRCPQGYILHQNDDGKDVCIDIDECADSPCDGLSCINTHGSYTCTYLEGHTTQATEAPPDIPMETPPTSRPADLYSQQTTIMWGICFGILSMFVVLIAMLCHRIKRHYIYQHDLDYNYKNTEKDVVLKKIMMEPQWQL
ncbi:thrombomodulin-like [Hyla sarda]|uniref:thrombomodulin-like n=1 Tax=Hyla sarda TaxID=327740 RepID=UPI0024C24715|nr:thrombomodulin-like [Hyla sarda]XP_056419361.1 thrombomodulin-like [Hyla sarda]